VREVLVTLAYSKRPR